MPPNGAGLIACYTMIGQKRLGNVSQSSDGQNSVYHEESRRRWLELSREYGRIGEHGVR